MSWFLRWNERRNLRKYGRRLRSTLRRLYGGGRHFTEGQIRRGVREARLNPKYISFAFAMFLPENEFSRLHPLEPKDEFNRKRAAVASVFGYDAAVHGAPMDLDLGGDFDGGGAGDGGGGNGD